MKVPRSLFSIFSFAFLPLWGISQSHQSDFYNRYDSATGIQNAAIYNGPVHLYPYRTLPGNDIYLLSDFTGGSVVFDKQFYGEVALKFDTYNDQLVCKSVGEYNYMSLNLSHEKVSSFEISGRKFVNLSRIEGKPAFIAGYYEEDFVAPGFTFFIKHKKDRSKRTPNDVVYDFFEVNNHFVIFHAGTYHRINTKKDVMRIFPNLKQEINSFYTMNRTLTKKDITRFFQMLMRHLNTVGINAK